ncbi:MAG: hypothetical protein ACREOU_15125 [Candidatus Eiseniibacteriota bacterium]
MRPARAARSRPFASLALAGLLVFAPHTALASTDSILAREAVANANSIAAAVAPDPFPPLTDATARKASSVVTPESVGGPSYTRAYIALGAGAALLLGSFLLAESADRAYERYNQETDPEEIEEAYDDAGRLDELAATTLIVGNLAIALGLYWRFIQHPKSSADLRTSQALDDAQAISPQGIEASLAPELRANRVGLAVTVTLP